MKSAFFSRNLSGATWQREPFSPSGERIFSEAVHFGPEVFSNRGKSPGSVMILVPPTRAVLNLLGYGCAP